MNGTSAALSATYRLQLDPDFGFDAARRLLPYLKRLGVSHLYLSPITEATPGSSHGYDVIDHNAVREDLGGREGLDRLLTALEDHELKVILDWVPNHAGVGLHNEYWQDVLAYGPNSIYARYFDIDWHPLKPELRRKVLLPFLGEPYGGVLDGGELGLAYDDGRFYTTYYESRFALAPSTYPVLLERALLAHERTEVYWDLKDLAEAYAGLSGAEREKAEVLRLRLAALAERADLSRALDLPTGELHELLEQQVWRLSYWKTAGYEINYRRFFDINTLVGLRMEDEHVFWDAHRLLGELLAHPVVDGVRIDHIDGLFRPREYLRRLRELGAAHVWVEKILAHGETLPEDWPVDGTTGYAFMNDAMRVLIDAAGELALDRAYRRFVPEARPYERTVYRSKRLVMETMLSSELFRLAYELDRISEADYHTRDFTLEALREALSEIVAAFGRYRTYLPVLEDGSEQVVAEAVHLARRRNPAAEPSVYEFVSRVILGDVHPDVRQAQTAWVGRFQQYTAPVAAKGVEDTAFYRYLRLAALNEVGGEPDHFSVTPQAFHAHARFRAHRYPRNLVATATHDHKRGEDTRMRLIALAARPDVWEETVARLAEMADEHRGHHGPARADEYLFYQMLVALWPDADRADLADRLATYTQKAARESKTNTSWINPDEEYETDLEAFVRAVVADDRTEEALAPLAADIARLGFANSMSQVVLKLTTPGVPDFYQGTEFLDLSLVDPDNRRPVDYEARQRGLDQVEPLIRQPGTESLRALIDAEDPLAKLFLTARLLRLRREEPELFTGDYVALGDGDDAASGWLAFARLAGARALVALVPRFHGAEREDVEFDLPGTLAGRAWTDVLTGTGLAPAGTLSTAALPLPWAVLMG
jgi:(1->4)-alpha-D-glucan 1-alpha-D-glucosylmutase